MVTVFVVEPPGVEVVMVVVFLTSVFFSQPTKAIAIAGTMQKQRIAHD